MTTSYVLYMYSICLRKETLLFKFTKNPLQRYIDDFLLFGLSYTEHSIAALALAGLAFTIILV